MSDLPGPLRLTSTFPFVGRTAELETLRTLMPRAAGEGRRIVLLGGEPGSGKSRLVREFATEAAGDGGLGLYGACDAVVRTPYGPFVEALDHLCRVIGRDELRAALGPAGGGVPRPAPRPPAAARPPGARGRAPVARDRRPRHGAPPAAHRSDRPTRRGRRAAARRARRRGRPLGRRPHPAAPAPPRPRR